ncbi:ATP-binding protein, partial [Flavihumibacter sediminis]|nr:ATP-binding protein [Flavihumibacter sediminis]
TEEYQAYAEDTGARLTYASEPIGRALHVDPHRLKQVVGNVISNAVKFSPKGGEVLITARPMNGHVRISVQDSGVGIPNGMEEQVFGRFNQVESSASQV